MLLTSFTPLPTMFSFQPESSSSSWVTFILLSPHASNLDLFNPFPIKQQILDSSKLKEFVDNNFKFNKNGRKFS